MDVSSTAGLASMAPTMSNSQLGNAIGVAVLNKALDIQAQSATQLIESIPIPTQGQGGLPEHLGQHINLTA